MNSPISIFQETKRYFQQQALFEDEWFVKLPETKAVMHLTLDEFYEEIKDCQRCPLGATRTKFVFGTGDPKAQAVFVGEAPGRDEDLQGEPFVGRAGQLLNKILESINLERKSVYICNIIKCRPPENRDPNSQEIATCIPYLEQQLRLIHPKIIVALGRISAQYLLNTNAPMNQLRKKMYRRGASMLMVTYHPAALLRNPNYKPDTWEDMKMLRRILDSSEGMVTP
jgi:uracil-DNA glycosylase family 4